MKRRRYENGRGYTGTGSQDGSVIGTPKVGTQDLQIRESRTHTCQRVSTSSGIVSDVSTGQVRETGCDPRG